MIEEIDLGGWPKGLDENDGRAKWIKSLAKGICHEKIEEKGPPIIISASKSFKKCKTFKELESHISLTILELNQKVNDAVDDFGLFPTQFSIRYRGIFDKKEHTEVKDMVKYNNYKKNERCVVDYAIPLFKAHAHAIIPATFIGV